MTLTWLVTQTAPAKMLLSAAPAHGTHVTQAQPAMSLPTLGLADSDDTLRVHKHMHTYESLEHQHNPSVHPAPLPGPKPSDPPHGSPTRWLVQFDTPNMQHSHTCPTGTPHSEVSLDTSMDPLPT